MPTVGDNKAVVKVLPTGNEKENTILNQSQYSVVVNTNLRTLASLYLGLRSTIPTVCENLPQQYSKGPDIRVNCVIQICQGLWGHPTDWTINLGGG